MRCILCDRCKSIVEDFRKIKVVTYAKPLTPGPVNADEPSKADRLWTKELCQACAEELENFMEQDTGADSGDTSEGGGSGTDGEMTE